MDFTGTFLGLLTIPMALLNVAAILSGLWVMARGDAHYLAVGIGLFTLGSIGASFMQRADGRLAEFARGALMRGRKRLAYGAAMLNSIGPITIIVIWEIITLWVLQGHMDGERDTALWLWSYGVVTGIWTLRAFISNSRNRTLTSIQAYSAQLSYVILSAAVLEIGWPLPIGIALMLLPMILPLIVGVLLAVADRSALRDVQV